MTAAQLRQVWSCKQKAASVKQSFSRVSQLKKKKQLGGRVGAPARAAAVPAISQTPSLAAAQPSASKVPAGFFDGETAQQAVPSSSKGASVPAGFFDAPPPGVGHLAPTATTKRNENPTAPVKAGAASIPAGFFDDSAADDKAREVDVKAKRKQQEHDEWEQFSAFKADIEAQEAAREKREEVSYQQRQERADVEAE